MLLKDIDQMSHQNWKYDPLANFIEFTPDQSNPRKSNLYFMINKPACTQMINDFCDLAKKYYPLEEGEGFLKRLLVENEKQ